MSSPLHDLDPEEKEFLVLFSSLRSEVFHLANDFASLIMQRVERRQADEERLEPPEPIEVVTSGLSSLLDAITGVFTEHEPPPGARDEDEDE